jgi:polysaccharide biosynthesis protein PslG
VRNVVKIVAAVATVAAISATASVMLWPHSRTIAITKTASINTSGSTIGIADSDMYGLSPEDVNRALDLIAGDGVRTVRLFIPWTDVESSPGAFKWDQVDLMVDAANARGMSVLGGVTSAPPWATAPGSAPATSPPADPATYGDFVGAVAARYRGRVAAYEIWNEPNSVLSWTSGPQGPEPGKYADLLKAAYPKIKAADPSATVIGGVLGSVFSLGALTLDPVAFVNQMYAAGAKGYFDALSLHPYQYTTKFSEGGSLFASPISQYDGMRQAMVGNGDGGKKIWATEYGEPTSSADEATQAAYITDFLTKWRTLPGAGPAYVYTTRDRNTGSGSDLDTLGIYRTDWTPKPAVAAIRALT